MATKFVATLHDVDPFFAKEGVIWETFARVARRLDDEGINYAAFDGIAIAIHGYMRFTSIGDVLVTEDGLCAVEECLAGNGFVRLGAKKLVDEASGVEVRFATGDLAAVATVVDGKCVIGIEKLIDWKLTDGLSGRLDSDLSVTFNASSRRSSCRSMSRSYSIPPSATRTSSTGTRARTRPAQTASNPTARNPQSA